MALPSTATLNDKWVLVLLGHWNWKMEPGQG